MMGSRRSTAIIVRSARLDHNGAMVDASWLAGVRKNCGIASIATGGPAGRRIRPTDGGIDLTVRSATTGWSST